eukprot:gene34476-44550_t
MHVRLFYLAKQYLETKQGFVVDHFPDTDIKVLYLCKPNLVPKLSPDAMRSKSYGLKIKAGENVSHLVGEKINDYVTINRFGAKMNGLEEWSSEEKQLPKISSRPPDPTFPVFSKAVSESPKSHVTDNNSSVSPSMLSGITGFSDVMRVKGGSNHLQSEVFTTNTKYNNNNSNNYNVGQPNIMASNQNAQRGSRSNSFNTSESATTTNNNNNNSNSNHNNSKADGSSSSGSGSQLPNLAYVPSWALN